MSPTVFRYKGYRFFFFSREEERMHVHIYHADGEAKFWIEPEISLAENHGLSNKQLNDIKKIIEDRNSTVEVTNISKHGFWLYINEKEYFLSFNDFPWFKDATVSDILNVQLLHGNHLYWPGLDVDLELDSIKSAEKFPLTYKA